MLCAIFKVAFAITCMCHTIVEFMEEERYQIIDFITSFSRGRQIVIQLPFDRLPEDADTQRLTDYMKDIEPGTDVRLVLVNFYDPASEDASEDGAIKHKIEFDDMMEFYRLLMELKKQLQSQETLTGIAQDFVVLANRELREYGVPALFALPPMFARFNEKHVNVDQTNPDIRPKFDGYYFMEWEHMWLYISKISLGIEMIDTDLTIPAKYFVMAPLSESTDESEREEIGDDETDRS